MKFYLKTNRDKFTINMAITVQKEVETLIINNNNNNNNKEIFKISVILIILKILVFKTWEIWAEAQASIFPTHKTFLKISLKTMKIL